MGAIDEVRNLEVVLINGLQALQDAIAQLPIPVITGVSPLVLDAAGGDTLTIFGNQFEEVTNVVLGANGPATSFTVVSDTEVTAVNPGGAVSMQIVTLENAYGNSDNVVSSPGAFAVGAFPMVTEVSPNTGDCVGGDTVTITGVGFTGATAVSFSGLAAAAFTVVNDTTITATTPADSGGAVTPQTMAIHVTTPVGVSTARNQDKYTFVPS